jgi:threonine dehydratase
MIDVSQEVLAAEKRIRPYIRETPVNYSFYLSRIAGCRLYLKLENLQHTGSFKARGAVNKLLSLERGQREAGVIAASTGNHGLAVAYGASIFGMQGTIFLPENASPQKIKMLRNYDLDIAFFGTDCEEAEIHARKEAEKSGRIYLSPYNDPHVLGGQGTIAVELLRQLDSIDCIMVSVGGGGLISGIAGYLKEAGREIEVIGCLPKNSPAMYDSIKAGQIVDSPILPTLSDGTAGGIDADSITFEPCRTYVDDWVLIGEDQIREGIKLIFEQHRYVIEGSAGVVVASFLKLRDRLAGKNVVLVICGGNIEVATFREAVC